MKKADAIRKGIEDIKAQNRSSFGPEDLEMFKKRYAGKFTASLAADFEAEAAKAGIKPSFDMWGGSFEDMLPKRPTTFAEREAGVAPGSQLRTNKTDLPEAQAKKLGVRKPITLTVDGIKTLLKHAQEKNGVVSVFGFADKLDNRVKYLAKNEGPDAVRQFYNQLNDLFPDGIMGIDRSLYEGRVYEQILYEQGYLEDADPDFKKLDKQVNELPEGARNRRSREGRRLLDIKDKGGVPAVLGRDKEGKLVYDPTKTIPYDLKLSEKGKEYVKDFTMPSFISSTTPTVRESIKPVSPTAQLNNDIREKGLITIGQSPSVSSGGEPVEPNRGPLSRVARGSVIDRKDVFTFKEAMSNVMASGLKDKDNLFKRVVEEARKIDPKVSLNSMQDIKDYLFFSGVLEADPKVSEKLGPSRISDTDVPEYVKPSRKFYSDGFKALDVGSPNEPLVIGKLSADYNFEVDTQTRTLNQLLGSEVVPEKKISERTSKLLEIIRKGGKYGARAIPLAAIADIATSREPLAAAIGSTPTARSSISEIQQDQERRSMERLQSADEAAFAAMEKEQAERPLQGSRGFLYLD